LSRAFASFGVPTQGLFKLGGGFGVKGDFSHFD
jgi:hypothetical protein